MDCPHCGEANIDGAARCWSCGGAMAPTAEPRSQGSRVLWAVVAVIAILGVLLLFSAGGDLGGGGGGFGSGSAVSAAASSSATPSAGIPSTATTSPAK